MTQKTISNLCKKVNYLQQQSLIS